MDRAVSAADACRSEDEVTALLFCIQTGLSCLRASSWNAGVQQRLSGILHSLARLDHSLHAITPHAAPSEGGNSVLRGLLRFSFRVVLVFLFSRGGSCLSSFSLWEQSL